MVGVRKFIEKFVFTKDEIHYLDDKMPEFTLRKREDAQKRKPKVLAIEPSHKWFQARAYNFRAKQVYIFHWSLVK